MSKRTRRTLLLMGPAALAASAQIPDGPRPAPNEKEPDLRLPNGKRQIDEILKSDYKQNLKEAHELSELASSFETELQKTDKFVLSLSMLKKLDDMERLVKRIRGRIRK